MILEEVIKSELIKKGQNEFFNNGQLTYYNDQYSFIKRMIHFDKDVQDIVTNKFFGGFTFTDPEMDHWFKRAWLARFSSQSIDFQTIERFAQEVTAITLIHQKETEALYDKFEKMLANTNHSLTENEGTGETQTRDVNSTLPQDRLNLDFNTFSMDYADDNQIGRSQNTDNSTSETTSERYDPSTFKMLMHLWDGYFNEYQDRCFMKIW